MRVVFLYGPPGVGKLTVGSALAALTGYRLFHNHLTVDPVLAVFPRRSPAFARLVSLFRREVFAAAAQEGVDLIFTYVYAHPVDEADVRALVEPVHATGGTVHFVQLVCARDELLQRVGGDSRRAYRKLNDPGIVAAMLDDATLGLTAAVPFAASLRLDVTHLPPDAAARRIAAHYRLSTPAAPPRVSDGPDS